MKRSPVTCCRPLQPAQNPTWDQPDNGNAQVKTSRRALHPVLRIHRRQKDKGSVIQPEPFNGAASNFSGAAAPHAGKVEVGRLTSAHIDDTNEDAQKVAITHSTVENFDPKQPYSLPPFSMTVLSWQ